MVPENSAKWNKNRIPTSLIEPINRPYVLSFHFYNDRECGIEGLLKNCPKKALRDIKIMGSKIENIDDLHKYNIDSKLIKRNGDYLRLYSGLTEDAQLYQHKLHGTARIFYFFLSWNKTIYIVAITSSHYETDKIRR
jgi:hypothetical protein